MLGSISGLIQYEQDDPRSSSRFLQGDTAKQLLQVKDQSPALSRKHRGILAKPEVVSLAWQRCFLLSSESWEVNSSWLQPASHHISPPSTWISSALPPFQSPAVPPQYQVPFLPQVPFYWKLTLSSLLFHFAAVSLTSLPQAVGWCPPCASSPMFSAGNPSPSHTLCLLYQWEEAGVCIRERSELQTSLSASGEPWQAPRLQVQSNFLAVVWRCSKGLLLNFQPVTCQNSLSEPEDGRMLIQCGEEMCQLARTWRK